jgi:hypothetical protein
MPTDPAPPQSPEMSPTPAKRTRRPSTPTAAPLIPWPQMRTMPHGRLEPARSAAKVSLRTSISVAVLAAASMLRSAWTSSG